MEAPFAILPKPDDYQPPKFGEVKNLLEKLRKNRQPFIEREWETKRALRGEWNDVLNTIPKAYRKMLLAPDMPQLRDMVFRVSGLIRKEPLSIQVLPPSPRPAAVKAASKEEARLSSIKEQHADMSGRDTYAMGIDSQVRYGESWISVWPDPRRMRPEDYKRREGEKARDYLDRYKSNMATAGIPLSITDHDPATVFPLIADDDSLAAVITETEHMASQIHLGMGYKPIRGEDKQITGWSKGKFTLGVPLAPDHGYSSLSPEIVDTTHDRGQTENSKPENELPVKKVVYVDPWVYQCYLDGILVEEWEHDYGYVPFFKAYSMDSSDRESGWESQGLIEPALKVAKQVVFFAAIMANSAAINGYPTPFLKNPQHGAARFGNEPTVRKVSMGELNFLQSQEEIEFPFSEANMGKDFMTYLEYLSGQVEESTLSNFGKALGSDIAGYAIAQIRSMQLSVLAPTYRNTERQWRNISYFIRHMVKEGHVPPLALRGAVEEDEDGQKYQALVEYGPKDTTEYAITCHIREGIQQDEIAERKSAIEMRQAGVWSWRRAMEKTGVEDPEAEKAEIDMDRVLSSPAADEVVLRLATQLAAQRWEATRQEQSSPLYQAIDQAKQQYMGGGGQFQNQGASPVNASPGGQPLNQQSQVPTPQQGGPMAGPSPEGIDMRGLGIQQTPGGVPGVRQTPAGAPG